MQREDELTLYGITDEFMVLENMIEESGGEVTALVEEKQDFLMDLLTSKVDGCCGFIQQMEDEVGAANNQIKKFQEFITKKKNAIENFKLYIQYCLDRSSHDSLEGTFYEIKNRKPSKVLVIANENDVPIEFTRSQTIVSIDKAGLKKAVKNGDVNVKGINLIDGKKSLSFKLKTNKKKKEKKDD